MGNSGAFSSLKCTFEVPPKVLFCSSPSPNTERDTKQTPCGWLAPGCAAVSDGRHEAGGDAPPTSCWGSQIKGSAAGGQAAPLPGAGVSAGGAGILGPDSTPCGEHKPTPPWVPLGQSAGSQETQTTRPPSMQPRGRQPVLAPQRRVPLEVQTPSTGSTHHMGLLSATDSGWGCALASNSAQTSATAPRDKQSRSSGRPWPCPSLSTQQETPRAVGEPEGIWPPPPLQDPGSTPHSTPQAPQV